MNYGNNFYRSENNQFHKCGEGTDKNIGKTDNKKGRRSSEEMKYLYEK